MERPITLELLAKHLAFLHGPSGSGKSLIQESIKNESEKRGLVKPIYLSSGDCYRELRKLNPEMAAKMDSGVFIEDLSPTMPKLELVIGEFIDSFGGAWTPILELDGFIRIGEYEHEGRQIPSQVDQIASAFERVLTSRVERGMTRRLDSNLVALVEEGNPVWGETGDTSLSHYFKEMIKNAHHLFIDVDQRDAEAMMRVRSENNLKSVVEKLGKKRGKLGVLRKLLEDAALIQEGKFRISCSKESVKPSKDTKNSFRLKSVPERYIPVLDKKMNKVVNEIKGLVKWGEKEKPSVSGAIKKLLAEKGVDMNGITIPRDDDLTFERRLSRIGEFNTKTAKGVLATDLSFKQQGEYTITTNIRKDVSIHNGSKRGVSLESMKASCQIVASSILSEIQVS